MIAAEKITKLFALWAVLGLCTLVACTAPTDGGDEDDGDGDGDPTTYELTVSASPSEGGSVDPENGTFDEDETVEVTATSADGWSFSTWSGDIESEENPLSFDISSDTDLTANFVEDSQATAYDIEIEISDGTNSEVLTFGMDPEGTDGFDEGLDSEAPPEPPSGSFFGNFVIDGYNLFADYRPVTSDRTVWEFYFDRAEENSLQLSWDISGAEYYGSLTLVDDPDDPSLEIDMESETSHEITNNAVNTMFIIQE